MHPRLLFAMYDPSEHDLSSRRYNDHFAFENAFDLNSAFRICGNKSRLLQPWAKEEVGKESSDG